MGYLSVCKQKLSELSLGAGEAVGCFASDTQ